MTAALGGSELHTPTRRTTAPTISSTARDGNADVAREDPVRELLAGLRRRREAALRLPALPHRHAAGLRGRDPWLSET